MIFSEQESVTDGMTNEQSGEHTLNIRGACKQDRESQVGKLLNVLSGPHFYPEDLHACMNARTHARAHTHLLLVSFVNNKRRILLSQDFMFKTNENKHNNNITTTSNFYKCTKIRTL